MPSRRHPTRCKFPGCEAPPRMITARGWCFKHGNERVEANIRELRARRGPYFENWYEALHRAFEHPRRLDEASARE